ncbi:MAG: hypothetical protein ACJ0N6_01520 [Thermodesulfobacteriota bacterium]|nr:hypothetical protein [Deltaproteobacteria bacterium TMED58]RZP16593.1 MAG: hypothetical protein EVA30_02610 [Candidatus Dadabacteria bacterium]|tara:strand:- start:187 stop:1089 length:903 start_codon:yes stop_codon:yes gene_type:complete
MIKFKFFFLFIFILIQPINLYANIDEGIAAIVNDEVIFLSDLNEHIKKSGIKSVNKKIQKKYLKELTDLKLLELQGKRMGISITEEQLDGIEKNFIETNTKEKVESELKRTGINLYRIRFGWKNQYLQESIATIILKGKIVISDNEIKDFYIKNYGKLRKDELANLFLVVTKNDEISKDKVSKLINNVKTNEQFSKVIDELKTKGYLLPESMNLGYISVDDLNIKISKAVKQSQTNNLVGPFNEDDKTKFFYVKNKMIGDSEFFNLKEEIKKNIADEKEFQILDKWFQDLRENAYISVRI